MEGSEAPFDTVRAVQDDASNYDETVRALIAFAAFVCHDGREQRPGSGYGFGRRMQTSSANAVSPNTVVTPDAVVQKGVSYGIAGDVKRQLPQERAYWATARDQLRKYDDRLTGWWTSDEVISHSDAVLLVHQSRSRAFASYLNESRANDESSVGGHSAVIEFNRADERQPYIFFRREWGTLCDTELCDRLENGVPVPFEKVLRSFPNLQFYDAPPPIEMMMTTLWMDSFASRREPQILHSETDVPLTVSVVELTTELQRAYGSGAMSSDPQSVEFPRQSWVRDAMDQFVNLSLAASTDHDDTYLVHYRPFPRDDLLQRFARMRGKTRDKASIDRDQLTLLGDLGVSDRGS